VPEVFERSDFFGNDRREVAIIVDEGSIYIKTD
jgi:hypothetical protein